MAIKQKRFTRGYSQFNEAEVWFLLLVAANRQAANVLAQAVSVRLKKKGKARSLGIGEVLVSAGSTREAQKQNNTCVPQCLLLGSVGLVLLLRAYQRVWIGSCMNTFPMRRGVHLGRALRQGLQY